MTDFVICPLEEARLTGMMHRQNKSTKMPLKRRPESNKVWKTLTGQWRKPTPLIFL